MPDAPHHHSQSRFIPKGTRVDTKLSVYGGGELGNLTISLVNDQDPGGFSYYGTDIFGERGWYGAFIASGPQHAAGLVPDPGPIAGTTRYLCEDGIWKVVISGGGGGGSGTSMSNPVTQTAHGLSVGNVVRWAGSSYVKALADTGDNAEVVGVVSAVTDADTFTLTTGGQITGLSGLTSASVYFLSTSTAGLLTATAPSVTGQISKPLLIATSSSGGYWFNWRGWTVGTPVGGGGGGGGPVAWGTITGTLSSQTDLQTILDGKQPLDSDLTSIAALATTSFGRAFLTQVDAAGSRTYIGAGTSNFDSTFASLTGKPTTLSGYGITDAYTKTASDAAFAPISHTHTFASLTSKPTTLSGYGITDAEPALGNPSVTGYVLSSTTAGVRSWIAPATGGGGGTVTSITATSPVVVTPTPLTSTGVISLTAPLTATYMPAHTGDVTSPSGSTVNTLANIPTATPAAGTILMATLAPPTAPAPGAAALYVDSSSKTFSSRDSSGNITHTIRTRTSTASNWINSIADDGTTTISQPAFSDISGSIAGTQLPAFTGDVTKPSGSTVTTLANIPTATPAAGTINMATLAAPTTPVAGANLYVDSTSKIFCCKDQNTFVTHGVRSRSKVSNSWIDVINDDGSIGTSQPSFSNLASTPTTLSGYGITDPVVLTSGSYGNPAWITSLAWSKITGTPTTLSGYGITDGNPAFTGDVTKSSGGTVTTLVNIPTATPAAGTIIMATGAAPTAPSTGLAALYVDSSSKTFSSRDSAGNISHTIRSVSGLPSNNFINQINDDGTVAYAAATGSGGSGSPGGSTTQVQFNDAGAFEGDSGLIWNKTTDVLTINTTSAADGLSVIGSDPRLNVTSTDATKTPGIVMYNSGGDLGSLFIGGSSSGYPNVVGFYFTPSSGFTWISSVNGQVLRLSHGGVLSFGTTPDVALSRNASGVLEVNSGTAGTLRDLTLRNITISGTITGPTTLAGYGIVDAYTKTAADAAFQPLDADLTSIAALATTSFGRSFLTQADATASRTYIGLGSVTNDAQIKASDFPSTSVDSEISLFSGTTGKAQKRATGTGLVTATAGVYGTVTANSSAVGLGSVTNDAQIKASDFPSTSVDGEISLFSGTTGKAQKRATGSGAVITTSGVYATLAAGTVGNQMVSDGTTWVSVANIPQNIQNAVYTLAAADAGKHLYHSEATTARTYTIPPNSTVAFPVGTAVTIVNATGSGTITLARGASVILQRGDGTAGNADRTIPADSVANIIKVATDTWYITGKFA